MGRFATTAHLYEQFRPPYPPAFFHNVAGKLGLSKRDRLIDLGTGPGLIALGFAPYVRQVVGVDPEPAMLEAAGRAAARVGEDLVLIEGTAERLGREVGPFDVVTIGRALHWMDLDLVGPLLERLVAPGGAFLVCSASSAADSRNAWHEEYMKARQFWSGPAGAGRHRPNLAAVLAGTRFRVGETVEVESRNEVSAGDLARRVLTFSGSSPAVLGERADAMLRDVEQRLLPFSRDGVIEEVVLSKADIAR